MAMRGVMSYRSSCGRPRGGASSSPAARKKLRAAAAEGLSEPGAQERVDPEFEFDEELIVARTQGREGWLREARRQLEQRIERLVLAAERLEVDLAVECRGNEAYEQFKERRRAVGGRRVGGPPKPYEPPQVPDGKVNLTDLNSKRLKAREGYVQGYNAQAVVDEGQIVLAGRDHQQQHRLVAAGPDGNRHLG